MPVCCHSEAETSAEAANQFLSLNLPKTTNTSRRRNLDLVHESFSSTHTDSGQGFKQRTHLHLRDCFITSGHINDL